MSQHITGIIAGSIVAFSFLSVLIILMLWSLIHEGKIFTGRAARRQHKMELERIRLRAELTGKGFDPEYVAWLERKELGR